MKKTLEQVLRLFIYASFFVPLILASKWFIFPFVVPKVLLFRSLVAAMLACYAVLLWSDYEEYRPRFTPLNSVIAMFVASFVFSTFLGTDAYHSFWDNHERMLGLFTVLHYIAYYFIVSAAFKTPDDWHRVLRVFLGAGSIAMLLAVYQKLDPQYLLNQGSHRTGSTLGNPIYVGGYGLFLFFTSALLMARERVRAWQMLAGIGGLLAIAGIFFSGTRGSLLGLLAGLAVVGVLYLWLHPEQRVIRRSVMVIAGVMILLLGVLFMFRTHPRVIDLPAIGPLLNTSFQSGTANTRLIAWNIAVQAWKERPIFGWGPNNFFYAFNKYYNPRSLEYGYGETWFDNAHNILLNTLAVQGMFGIITYLGIFAIALYSLYRSRHNRELAPVVIWGGGFLIAHLVQNVTVFENATSYLYFMFWLALVNRLTAVAEPPTAKKTTLERQPGWGLVAAAGLGAVAFIFVFNVQPARANNKTLRVMRYLYQDPAAGLVAMRDALAFTSPHIDDIRADLSRSALDALAGRPDQLSKEQATELIQLAYTSLQENIALHPRDIRNYLLIAQIAQLDYTINKDPRSIVQAEQYVQSALPFSPRRQQLLYLLANLKAQLTKKQEAVQLLEQAINDNPNIAESYWRLAYIYHVFGDNEQARLALQLLHARNLRLDEQGLKVENLVLSSGSKEKNK